SASRSGEDALAKAERAPLVPRLGHRRRDRPADPLLQRRARADRGTRMTDAPAPIRVLVVDDSALARRILVDVLRPDTSIDVVGTAQNDRIALDRIHELQPDVVVLDVEMPKIDDIELLQVLRDERNQTRVIMCSSLTARGATATLDTLSLGALDYVTKPTGM